MPSLLSETYLNGLLEIAAEDGDFDFLWRLMSTLRQDYAKFQEESQVWHMGDRSDPQDWPPRLHRLKNSFLNLGALEAGSVVEELYQLSRQDPRPIEELLRIRTKLEQLVPVTLGQLENILVRASPRTGTQS